MADTGMRQIADGYYVSRDGRVFSTRVSGGHSVREGVLHELTPHRVRHGYLTVRMQKPDGRGSVRRYIHRLVLEAFVGAAPAGHEARHLDGSRDHNSLENLEWATRKVNHADKLIHGTRQHGSRNGASVLRETDIPLIRNALKHRETIKAVAARFGVERRTIQDILHGRRWAHVAEEKIDG